MDGADDVAVLEVGRVEDAAESCCSMCAEREGCVGWDTYRESAGSYLCQVMRWAAGGLMWPCCCYAVVVHVREGSQAAQLAAAVVLRLHAGMCSGASFVRPCARCHQPPQAAAHPIPAHP